MFSAKSNSKKSQKSKTAIKKTANAIHSKNDGTNLTAKEISILMAVGKLDAVGHDIAKRDMVQALSGNAKTPESFKKNMGSVKKKGFLSYPSSSTVELTEKGKAFVGNPDPGTVTNKFFHENLVKVLLNKKQCTIFDFISDGKEYNKKEVAKALGYDMGKLSGYEKDLSKMKTLGFIEKTKTSITLTDMCFPLGRNN